MCGTSNIPHFQPEPVWQLLANVGNYGSRFHAFIHYIICHCNRVSQYLPNTHYHPPSSPRNRRLYLSRIPKISIQTLQLLQQLIRPLCKPCAVDLVNSSLLCRAVETSLLGSATLTLFSRRRYTGAVPGTPDFVVCIDDGPLLTSALVLARSFRPGPPMAQVWTTLRLPPL